MPFPLADLKRTYGRGRDETRDVRPYLLVGKELEAQRERLGAAIDWYAAHEGKARADVSEDDFAVLVGDYRLARCLASCLQQSLAFLPPADGDRAVEARLVVFDLVNEGADGFAVPDRRAGFLAGAASRLGLGADEIEALLWSDGPHHERLTRVAALPTVESLATHYNRRAIETLLVRALSAELFISAPDGTTIRRLYLAVKRAGLVCELSLQEPDAGPVGGVWAHLFGPLEIFGPRTRHGDRFSRAVLELLRAFPSIAGSARVLLNEREYTLRLPRGLFDANAESTQVSFDSTVEEHLFHTLRGMERTGDTRSWIVLREPEPIVHESTVLVPDFALDRPATRLDDPQRVFVEVIGFWTPAYRERKKAKLLALAGSVSLVLVVQEELAPDFAGLPFEILPYKRRPSAHDLIVMLARAYPMRAPPRRARPKDLPSAETTRAEWDALFGSTADATASALPAAPDTPGVE